MRILNAERLASHGNRAGRQAALDILEAGLQAADPYNYVRQLLRVDNGKLVVGNPDYEPLGSPRTGYEVFDLSAVDRIFVIGAAKGIQYAAKAFEDVLGDHLTGGHVIAKHGDEPLLSKIGVTFGAHPVPDEGCVVGCERILDLCASLTPRDLVFTVVGNGVSSLLTLPVPGVTLEEVRDLTYVAQIAKGMPTGDLNKVRNHLDLMKGGRISRHLHGARAIHLVLFDPNDWDYFMHRNLWLHTLPEPSTFADAVSVLERWEMWDEVAPSIRAHLTEADPADECVRPEEFNLMDYRIFGVMPERLGMVPSAMRRAKELGFEPHALGTPIFSVEASQAGLTVAQIARTIERQNEPVKAPCALFTSGEVVVTVGKENGVGGRNQEWALTAATTLAGSKRVVMAGVDTDGTDGPGPQFSDDCRDIPCLAGGIVDGETLAEAKARGVDVLGELKRHNTTPALWRLDSGIVAAHNVSLGDLTVTLVL